MNEPLESQPQSTDTTPTPILASAQNEPSSTKLDLSKLDINKLLLPGAILLAAIMVSGALLFTRSNGGTGANINDGAEDVFAIANLKKMAKDVGLNTSQFATCLDSQKYKDEIDTDLKEGQAAGVTGTPSFFVNGTNIVGAQPFEAFKIAIDQAIAGKKGTVVVSADTDPVLGLSTAPVTIIEFSDYQCPYCRRFYQQTLDQIKTEYIDTGKVKFVYRDFPLSSIHPGALPAALAAECANEQGKYWEMHDKIFQEQI